MKKLSTPTKVILASVGALILGIVSLVVYNKFQNKKPTVTEIETFGEEIKDIETQPVIKELFPLNANNYGVNDKVIKYLQRGLNMAYGAGLTEDSVWGKKTQTALLNHHKRYTVTNMADYAKILKELNTIAENRK